jgi:hypothetical protein
MHSTAKRGMSNGSLTIYGDRCCRCHYQGLDILTLDDVGSRYRLLPRLLRKFLERLLTCFGKYRGSPGTERWVFTTTRNDRTERVASENRRDGRI